MRGKIKNIVIKIFIIALLGRLILAEGRMVLGIAKNRQPTVIVVANDSTADTSYGLRCDVYSAVNELSFEGYRVDREEYTIDDAEYVNWRNENMPVYGVSTNAVPGIRVSAVDIKVKNEDIWLVTDCLARINPNFIQKMSDDNWEIIVTGGYLSSTHGMGCLAKGVTDYKEHTITLVGCSVKKYYAAEDTVGTVYHEIGHIVAKYAEEEIRKHSREINSELNQLYCHTANGSLYVYMNSTEILGECFNDFMWYPREMKKQAPMLFEIYNDVVGQYHKDAM